MSDLLSDTVGHCRTVGLSDCRLSDCCRTTVGDLSDLTVGLSYRGSVDFDLQHTPSGRAELHQWLYPSGVPHAGRVFYVLACRVATGYILRTKQTAREPNMTSADDPNARCLLTSLTLPSTARRRERWGADAAPTTRTSPRTRAEGYT